DHGRADLAYRIAGQETQPGWGWWIKQGATTLWEQWRGTDSRNHIMYGDILAWFYKTLAGINPDPEVPGFKHFIIKPHVVGDLSFLRASFRSVRGSIKSACMRGDFGPLLNGKGNLVVSVDVPANSTATLYVPAQDKESASQIEWFRQPKNPLKPVQYVDGYA